MKLSLIQRGVGTSPAVTFGVLALATSTYAVLQSMVIPALPEIQAELGASPNETAWLMTAFLLSTAVATPIIGRLGDAYGKKRLLLVTLSVFLTGTLLASATSSLAFLILARVVQGVGGAAFPIAFGIIRDELPQARVHGAIGMISSVLGIGSGLGIVLSGPITGALGYHALFWLPAIVTGLAILAAARWLPRGQVAPVRARVSVIGAVTLAGWLVCLLLAISQGPEWGWASPGVLGLLVAGAVILTLWVPLELRATEPLVDMRMMVVPALYRTNIAAALFGFAMYGSIVVIPAFVQTDPSVAGYGFGASLTEAGLFMLPSAVAMLVASMAAGRISVVRGPRVSLVLAAVISSLASLLLLVGHAHSVMVYIHMFVSGLGIGLGIAAMPQLVVDAVPGHQTGVASGMNTNIRTIGGSIGTTVLISVVSLGARPGHPPLERGYLLAFGIMALAFVVAAVAASTVPRRPTGDTEPRPAVPAPVPLTGAEAA